MEIICVDTNLLIDYFRKKDKEETRLYKLASQYQIVVCAITAYEFLRGQKENDEDDLFLTKILSIQLPFDEKAAQKAAEIYKYTKTINKLPETEDLLIAATALAWNYPLATNNTKHFEHIGELKIK